MNEGEIAAYVATARQQARLRLAELAGATPGSLPADLHAEAAVDALERLFLARLAEQAMPLRPDAIAEIMGI